MDTEFMIGLDGFGLVEVCSHPTMSYDDFRREVASLYFDLTASPTASSLKSLLEVAPPSQILIGFDYPMRPSSSIAPALRDLEQGGLLDSCSTEVAFGNALRVRRRQPDAHQTLGYHKIKDRIAAAPPKVHLEPS